MGAFQAEAAGLRREFTKWWDALWSFAPVERVSTHKASERSLRWRCCGEGELRVGQRSRQSVCGAAATVVASCRKEGQALLNFPVAAGEATLRAIRRHLCSLHD